MTVTQRIHTAPSEQVAHSITPHRREPGGGTAWSIYVLLGAAVLLEASYSAPFPDDVGQFLPFFLDISSWTHIKGLSVSLGELWMLGALILLLVRMLSERTFRFDRGSLMRPLGLYISMVLVAEVYGLVTGGNSTTSLWEVRSQIYMLIAYVLACNALKTRRQVDGLIWIVLIGTGLKGIQGVWRYIVTLHGNIHTVEALFPHEQSYFFNAFLTLTPILFLYAGSRRMKRVALALLPMVCIAALANQRRAAVLGLGIGLIGLLVLTVLAHPRRRRIAAAIIFVLALAWPPYYAAFKNSSGLVGEAARAVNSNSHPDPRDASSNLYRQYEDSDIMATMKSSSISTVIGYGFGKPMLTPFPLPDISMIYPFWNIMPHNSILWVWMRMGTIGYLLLWLLLGVAIIQAIEVFSRLQDPYLKGLALWIALMIIQQVAFGYTDLQWTNYRNMITLGVLFALISRLARFAHAEEGQGPTGSGDDAPPPRERRRPNVPRTLTVVEGRLVGR